MLPQRAVVALSPWVHTSRRNTHGSTQKYRASLLALSLLIWRRPDKTLVMGRGDEPRSGLPLVGQAGRSEVSLERLTYEAIADFGVGVRRLAGRTFLAVPGRAGMSALRLFRPLA